MLVTGDGFVNRLHDPGLFRSGIAALTDVGRQIKEEGRIVLLGSLIPFSLIYFLRRCVVGMTAFLNLQKMIKK